MVPQQPFFSTALLAGWPPLKSFTSRLRAKSLLWREDTRRIFPKLLLWLDPEVVD
jgi:hypothetical protein